MAFSRIMQGTSYNIISYKLIGCMSLLTQFACAMCLLLRISTNFQMTDDTEKELDICIYPCLRNTIIKNFNDAINSQSEFDKNVLQSDYRNNIKKVIYCECIFQGYPTAPNNY